MSSGAFSPKGFKHSSYAYEVRAQDASGALLQEGWAIDNYYHKGGDSGPLEAKEHGAYKTTLHFDTDGDGRSDEKQEALVYDLRFVHRVHSGVIWLRSVPLSQIMRDKELRVIMQNYIDNVAGAGYEVVNWDAGDAVVLEKRFAAELLAREEGTLGGKPAFAAEFAVANIDQIHVAKNARKSHVKVVLVRPGFEYDPDPSSTGDFWDNPNKKPKGEKPASKTFPVILAAGYASSPEDFAKGLGDFNAFLERITFGKKSGVQLTALRDTAPTPAPAAAAEPVTPTPPPAPAPAPTSPDIAAPAPRAPATPPPTSAAGGAQPHP